MTQRFSKIIICIIAVMCLFCNTFVAFATNDDIDFDFNIQPIEPTTQEEVIETEKETEIETETEKETAEETKKPVQKPTKPETTKANQTQGNSNNNNSNNNNNNNNNANVVVTEQKVEQTTEDDNDEPPLPEGSFYVFLERNNGQRRLKTIMNGAGYLPEPEEPIRKGYVFKGWYADPKFEKKWDFMVDKAKKEMTIYAKWATDVNTIAYDIVVEDCVGGVIEVSPRKASLGEPVMLTVTPDEGKRLVQGSIKINGEATDFLSFIMPKGKVTISAEFENIPDTAGDTNEKSKLPAVICIGVIALIIIVIAIIIAKKRMDFNADLDSDEGITEDTEDENWIDETIVVEDGFKDGKKVVESVEPDYGAPDADIEDFE